MANLLSGASVSTDQGEIRVGTSMDQVLANAIGDQTAVPSLVLGVEPTELRLEDGLSMIYGSCISWASATKPATKEIYPSRVFDLLVGDGAGRASTAASSTRCSPKPRPRAAGQPRRPPEARRVPRIDPRHREAHRARAARRSASRAGGPTLDKPDLPRPKNELPQDVPDHMRLMLDLIVLAFQMDKTRVATLMLNNDLSQMNFGFLEGVQGACTWTSRTTGTCADKEAMYLKTNQFHVAQFAYLIERMKAIAEGEGSPARQLAPDGLLEPVRRRPHEADEMPILLAGRGGGTLKAGRILDYLDKGDANRKVCSLYLSLMDRMGVKLDGFGDATTRLAEL